ncbi:MAG TPA: hypothetical protein VMR98_01915 [Candidatus Polarisedimenticolaceae bacterium]|nr:hypothetical protein [Candidatus Polarisedimenticolaceae bacterium]
MKPDAKIPENRDKLRRQITTREGEPLWVVIYKKSSGKQGVTYRDVVEEAICFGLIDTITKTVDADTYAICLRRRKAKSNWTEANFEIARRMVEQGKMTPEGMGSLPDTM